MMVFGSAGFELELVTAEFVGKPMPASIARVTASFGIAELDNSSREAEPQLVAQALLTNAENALHEAKHARGGTVVRARSAASSTRA